MGKRRSDKPNRSDQKYDLAIVGSGSAAFAAAIRARDLGARVVMVERGTLGGTCVNIGCIPSKMLLRASDIYYQTRNQPFAGIDTEAGTVDLRALIEQKDALIKVLRREKYEELVGTYGWEVIRGEAAFADDATLEVGDRVIKASAYVIATGASPAVPRIPGIEDAGYLTSTTALSLDHVPESLVVIGSGYIALELGQLFHHLGSRVTLMQRGPRILREYEPEVAEAVAKVLVDEGIEVITGASIQRVERTQRGRKITLVAKGRERDVEGEQLLAAIGRSPNTRALGLDRAGISIDRGAVKVNDELRTTNPGVWAAGDVTGGSRFVYVAAYEGTLAAENALATAKRVIDLRAVPAVVFTTPSIATVGLTEAQARAVGHQVKTSILPAEMVPRAIVNRDTRGVFKIVADAATDQILGVHIVADNAGDVIYSATLAVKFKLTTRDLVETFAPYLTMAEGLKLTAQTFGRDVARLSCCAS
ncbi:MAG: mercury(II) reductase [Chloroflexi bacterium]|nr:mercury(II) reductase [Chloroflexota bacterium]